MCSSDLPEASSGQKCCLDGASGGDGQGAGQKCCLGGAPGDGEEWMRGSKDPNQLKKSGGVCQVRMEARMPERVNEPRGTAPKRDGGQISVVEGSASQTEFLMTQGAENTVYLRGKLGSRDCMLLLDTACSHSVMPYDLFMEVETDS